MKKTTDGNGNRQEEKDMDKKTVETILNKANLPITATKVKGTYMVFQLPAWRQAELGAYILKQKGFEAEGTGQLLSVKIG